MHHLMWDESQNAHLLTHMNLDKVQVLIDMLAHLDFQMVLPKGIPTLHAIATGNYARPDNVFASSSLSMAVIWCNTIPGEWPPRSDHIPVITVISAAPEVHIEAPRPNFMAADWEEVREEMALKLEDLEVDENICTKAEFDTQLNQLMQVITEVIDTKVQKTRPSPYQKRWWSSDLTQKHIEVRQLTCRAHNRCAHPDDHVHNEHKCMRCVYSTMIEIAKKWHWESFLKSVDESMVWTAHRYVSGDSTDGCRVCVPTLKVHQRNQLTWEAESHTNKSTLLQETFFLRLSQEEPQHDKDTYPAPSFHFSPVTDTQIHHEYHSWC